jgi:hypothetical protein
MASSGNLFFSVLKYSDKSEMDLHGKDSKKKK